MRYVDNTPRTCLYAQCHTRNSNCYYTKIPYGQNTNNQKDNLRSYRVVPVQIQFTPPNTSICKDDFQKPPCRPKIYARTTTLSTPCQNTTIYPVRHVLPRLIPVSTRHVNEIRSFSDPTRRNRTPEPANAPRNRWPPTSTTGAETSRIQVK